MNIIRKYLVSGKKSDVSTENQVNYERTSQEQVDFANGAIEIFNPVMKQFGFDLLNLKVTEYSTSIIWIKGKCYLEIRGNTHPHDSPNYYGIALGEFKEEYFHYSELDCVGLWQLKAIQDSLDKVSDTPFPFGANIQLSLIQTRDELLKYGKTFLQGDLTHFYFARSKQWNQ